MLVGSVTSLLLVGCGAGPAPYADSPSPTATSSTPTPTSRSTPTSTQSASPTSKQGSAPGSAATPTPGSTPSPSATDTATAEQQSDSGLEMPEAPEPTVDSLSELVVGVRTDPLVTAPLPRAADARGRLATGFPAVLRPTRSSRVESSSVSPSGPRLQVALVGSTALAPGDVLMAYRTRLTGRGLAELAAPASSPGSESAAFRRGRSVVTITVTSRGSGTDYAVNATLHTGGE